jgi:hypothetical protein
VNRNKRKGSAFESRVVARALKAGLEARKQPGSGVFNDYPNDLVIEGWLGEAKTRTDHPSLTQMLAWLDGVQANAKKGREFFGGFLVYNQVGSRKPIVMLSLDDFLSILRLGVDKDARG